MSPPEPLAAERPGTGAHASRGTLEIRDLDFGFDRANPVLSGIDLVARPEEFVSVVGPSGCGKTTLLRLAAGLLAPTTGEVRLDGAPVRTNRRAIGVVFQNDRLLPWRRVVDNVAIVLTTAGATRAAARARAEEQLAMVGLAGSEQKYPHQLSGGMRQRVNLARALVTSPDIVLLDEPFAALDAQTRELMQEELLTIWQRNRATVLLVTHQLDEAVFLSDRVVVLGRNPGRVLRNVTVPFARPRSLELKHHGEFHRVTDEIWHLIKDEVATNLRA